MERGKHKILPGINIIERIYIFTEMENSPPVSPKATRESVSPATSTPGQHQIFSPLYGPAETMNSPARVRHSELSESDESAITSSPTREESTVIYEKPDDDTTIIEQSPDKSCVADRTRANSSLSDPNSTVVFNLTNLMERIKRSQMIWENLKKKKETLN